MAKKGLSQRKRLAAIFASFSILIIGTLSLAETMSIDYYSVLNTLQKVIPASVIIGSLGWVIGMILDKPKKARRISFNDTFLNNVMKDEIPDMSETETNIDEPANKSDQ